MKKAPGRLSFAGLPAKGPTQPQKRVCTIIVAQPPERKKGCTMDLKAVYTANKHKAITINLETGKAWLEIPEGEHASREDIERVELMIKARRARGTSDDGK